jgi:thymidylate synthase ThyX
MALTPAAAHELQIAAQTRDQATSGERFAGRRVYSVVGVPPEIQAYALAKYSRSNQGMLETIQELSQQKAEQFLNTFYFQYGHRSIADLAHLVFGLEQISILAAIDVVDEQVWDGQERSTRYQPFRKTGWYLPPDIADTPAARVFETTCNSLFSTYQALTSALLEHLQDAVPRPDDMDDGLYKRTLRARAFDVARSLLPMATHTSVGQIVSARVLERQIARLLGAEYAEVRAIGAELKSTCQTAAQAPLSHEPQPPAAPTLVKYADASPYTAAVARDLAHAAEAWLGSLAHVDRQARVELAPPGADLADETVATLLYRYDVAGHSYRQILKVVADMSAAQKHEVLELSLAGRGRHDDLPREHQAGYGLVFDVLVDVGSFRDLHRHRRCVQVRQAWTWAHGFDAPEDVFVRGLGPRAGLAALEAGLADTYVEALDKASFAADGVRQHSQTAADYLLPLAYRTRCLFKMDWAQAAYMIEQRTQPQGHFSYRWVAWDMYSALLERYPDLARHVRATDPHAPLDLLRR